MSGPNIKKSVYILLSITMLMLPAGCHVFWEPSDKEALNIVRVHYFFTGKGKVVKAEIIERGDFIKECKCYPIKFQITLQDERSFQKTFYFFKNEMGEINMSEFEHGLR